MSCSHSGTQSQPKRVALLLLKEKWHLSGRLGRVQSLSWSFSVDLAEDWQQECCSFPRTYRHNKVPASSSVQALPLSIESSSFRGKRTRLCTSHEVALGLDNGDGVFLHRGGSGVAAQRDVAHDDLAQVHVLELQTAKSG